MNFLVAFLVAVVVFCSYLLIDKYRLEQKRRESLRLRIAPDGSTRGTEFEEPLLTADQELTPHGKMMAGVLRGLGVNVDEAVRKLERRFLQAGLTSIDAPIIYLFFQRVVSLFLFIVALMLMLGEGQDILVRLVGLIVAVIALFGPYLYVQNRIDKRKQVLQRAFPDTLDLLLICVESGLALDAALTRVTAELGRAYPEMTAELNRTRLELALINDRVRALINLGERTGMVQFRALVASLIQSERFGTSLTDTLRVLSEDFRLDRLAMAEAKAARLPVLLTIPLVFLLLPAFLLILMGPAIVMFVRQGGAVTGSGG